MTSTPVARARSLLFVPAGRPERFGKALDSGADCVILDLEDAVPMDQKEAARDQLAGRLPGFSQQQLARTLVRINAADTSWHADDLRLLAEWTSRGLAGVMVPKADAAQVLNAIAASLGPSATLVPLVESLAGLDAADRLASASQVARLAFGHLDFQLDLGMRCGVNELELMPVRFALVAASRRALLQAPIDGVTTDTGNSERLQADTQRARGLGYGAKLCIHPAQVAAVNEAFSPSPNEVEWARRVLAAAQANEGRAFSLDGRMVDLPVIRLAQQTLEQALAIQ
ncbi:HpcH/HpaI aldolase [Acidovorax delafieldii 2AN]|uniref:HpcH/HpaI aldolase n=1 Tax=Acidovorax delafieldii 2AN TaxID=573060 RepID=C5T5H6_ACIDE|nr:CoA ester lyase [Acidovorax delafieldii]EER60286.1 HpcH/HpaI aldolase [Acidovorax delafieldii 2AN]